MSHQMSIVLTTVASEGDAEVLGGKLLGANLAACVQEIPVRSRYRWKGKVQCESEILMLVKTASGCVAAAMAAIRKEHPYELPEIIVLPVRGGIPEYLTWIADETRAI